jgi:transposase InsO family protein
VERSFSAAWPIQLWVADLTYVATWSGFVFVAFVGRPGDAHLAPADPAGRTGASLRQGQYLSIRSTERLAEAGAVASVGSRGDSYDNALAEIIIGLYKTELIRRRGPWKGLDEVEYATLEWVDWFNHRRLLEPIGHVPPAEFEVAFRREEEPRSTQAPEPPMNPGRFRPICWHPPGSVLSGRSTAHPAGLERTPRATNRATLTVAASSRQA